MSPYSLGLGLVCFIVPQCLRIPYQTPGNAYADSALQTPAAVASRLFSSFQAALFHVDPSSLVLAGRKGVED